MLYTIQGENLMKKLLTIIISLAFILQPTYVLASESSENLNKEELLILVEDSTNREIKSLTKDAGAEVKDINTLSDGNKLAKIVVDETEVTDTTETLENEEKIIFVQPNYKYQISEDTDNMTEDVTEVTKEVIESEPIEETADSEEADEEEKQEEKIEEPVLELDSSANDTYASSQWYLDYIQAYDVWDEGSNNVKVAVIDTGCQLDHPDINILESECVSFNDGKQGSFTQWDGKDDDNGHGTHVCGIIGAIANNNTGIAGIANNKANIIVIDAVNTDFSLSTQDVVLAIDYATQKNAKLVNLSLSGEYRDFILENAIDTAYNNGVLCICAGGNESTDAYITPGDSAGAICVMNINNKGNLSSSSNFGAEKDIAAPGTDIYSTYTSSTYKTQSGTSMAAPVVTGTATLLLSKNPNLTPRQIKNILYASAVDSSASLNNNYGDFGFGIVNAKNAINSLSSTQSASKIALNKTEVYAYKDEEFFIEHAIYPSSAYKTTVSYKSSNSNVATVENGFVKTKAPGTATITVTTSNGLSASCSVTVKNYDYVSVGKVDSTYTASGVLNSFDPNVKVDSSSYIGSIFESRMDGYEVSLTKDEKYTFSYSASGIYPYMRLVKDGTALKEKVNASSTTPRTVSFTYQPSTSGTYYAELFRYPTGASLGSSSYTFSITMEHNLIEQPASTADCNQNGWEKYYKCKGCGALFASDGKTPISSIPYTTSSHNWGSPSYVWDGEYVTATRTCSKNSSHIETEKVKATSRVVKTATCKEEGSKTYTASFNNNAFTTQTKTVSIPKTACVWNTPVYTWNSTTVTATRTCTNGHTETETVPFTKTTSGNTITYRSNSFTNPAFTVQIKTETTGTAFSWKDPTYTWSSDNKTVTATRKSTDPTISETETVSTKAVTISSATCSQKGKIRYEAVFKNSAFKTQYKEVSTNYGSHSWNSPTYTWSSNYKTVTARRVCRNNSSHIETETAYTTSKVTKNATTTAMGVTTYTATFKNTAFSTQSKAVTNIAKLQPKYYYDLAKVKILTPKKGKKSFTVKWKAISSKNKKKIKGIQIQYSPYKDFRTYSARNISKNKASYKITKLASKKTYYVRIRVYNGNHYSYWSAVKSVKTK